MHINTSGSLLFLWCSSFIDTGTHAIIKVSVHQCWGLAGAYDLKIEHFFRSGWHRGYLVYSSFFAQCSGCKGMEK